LDLLSNIRFEQMSHIVGRSGAGSWNLLFADGHVSMVVSKTVAGELKRRGPVADYEWDKFDDFRDILEWEAQGKNPFSLQTRSGNPLVDRLK
jgi:prepilin-type processing-associated H-X9-DG protein